MSPAVAVIQMFLDIRKFSRTPLPRFWRSLGNLFLLGQPSKSAEEEWKLFKPGKSLPLVLLSCEIPGEVHMLVREKRSCHFLCFHKRIHLLLLCRDYFECTCRIVAICIVGTGSDHQQHLSFAILFTVGTILSTAH